MRTCRLPRETSISGNATASKRRSTSTSTLNWPASAPAWRRRCSTCSSCCSPCSFSRWFLMRSSGRQALGIRVVMDTGRPITPAAAVVRNLVRILDTYFVPPLLPALLTIFLHRSNKRPGDIAAGTIVVRDRPTDWTLGAGAALQTGATQPADEPLETGPPELSEQEFR